MLYRKKVVELSGLDASILESRLFTHSFLVDLDGDDELERLFSNSNRLSMHIGFKVCI